MRHTYRVYPTKQQAESLSRIFGSCRFVFNRFLRIRTDAWFKENRSIGYNESSAMLTELKRQPETEWLNEISCVPTQQALRHLQTAYINFWNKTAKYPTFKKKRGKQTAEYTRSAFKWDAANRNLSISGIGRLDIHWSRGFQSIPTTVTITKLPSGKYFVTLCLDEVRLPLPKTGLKIGIDLGVSRLATLSNGEQIPNPRALGTNLLKLKKLQRKLAKKKKGSGRRRRAILKVARLQEHIANMRKDHLYKVTTDLVRRFDVIQIEDLNVRGMVRNHKLARVIGDAAFGMFRGMLTYKCDWYEKDLRIIDPFFPSSKRCNVCGYILESLPLSIREWYCPECKTHHDRDDNAAINIRDAEGHSVKARGEVTRPVRASARKGRPRRNVNQLGNVKHSV